ncbi:hypothetical protein PQR62_00010 [Herbaspirillum lusitanum]|uniref:Lipoprotein n=1 Tax=Herbaspirillum lusitanum TaxID=213312 RepID=A0ABW9A451_9BURK
MLKNICAMAAIAIGLVGCAAPAHIPLSEENAKKIQVVNVRSMVVQDEVIARADPSNISAGMGGGLIPALIDASVTASRQEKLQTAMESFYESIDDYDFRSIYWSELSTELRERYPLKIKTIVTTPRGMSYRQEQALAPTLNDNEGEMLMATIYFLSPDLRTLTVSTRARLLMKGALDPVYKNTFTYQSSIVGTGGEQSAKSWSEGGGKPFLEKLREGVHETLAMLTIDMKNNAPVPANAEKVTAKYNFGEISSGDRNSVKGSLVEKHGDRIVLRNDAGELFSVLP